MSNFVITSDVVQRLKKIRQGIVYNDLYAVLDELVQNSYRAKATMVNIDIENDTLVISDNGEGCLKPDPLFTLDVSGFGVGFGEGFNSVYMVADELEVETLDWKGYLNVKKALSTKDLSVNIRPNNHIEGFKVHLKGEKIRDNQDSLIEYAKKSVSFIPHITFMVNGERVIQQNLFSTAEMSPFHNQFNNRLYEGVISLTNKSDYGVEVYFEYRHVTTVYKKGVKGTILLKPNAVNLRVPDRKGIIYDHKRSKLEERIEKDTKSVSKNLLQDGDNDDIYEYSDIIETYMDVKEYINFLTISEDSILNQYETREQSNQEFEEENTPSFMDNVSDSSYEATADMLLSSVGQTFSAEPTDTIRQQNDMSFTSYVKPNRHLATKDDMNSISIRNINKKKNVVWVEKEIMEKYENDITQYEYYGVFTFIAPHILYAKALQFLGIPHIAEMEERGIKKEYKVKKTGARSKKEERVMELLSFLERKLKLPRTFYVSNIECKMIVELRGTKIYQKPLMVAGYAQGPVIHLNRKNLKFGKLSSIHLGKGTLSIHDVKFLLSNIELIAHELAHLIYNSKDSTKEHYEAQNTIQNKIGDIVMNSESIN